MFSNPNDFKTDFIDPKLLKIKIDELELTPNNFRKKMSIETINGYENSAILSIKL